MAFCVVVNEKPISIIGSFSSLDNEGYAQLEREQNQRKLLHSFTSRLIRLKAERKNTKDRYSEDDFVFLTSELTFFV